MPLRFSGPVAFAELSQLCPERSSSCLGALLLDAQWAHRRRYEDAADMALLRIRAPWRFVLALQLQPPCLRHQLDCVLCWAIRQRPARRCPVFRPQRCVAIARLHQNAAVPVRRAIVIAAVNAMTSEIKQPKAVSNITFAIALIFQWEGLGQCVCRELCRRRYQVPEGAQRCGWIATEVSENRITWPAK